MAAPAQLGSANPGSQAHAAPDFPVAPAAFPAPGSPIDELGSHGPGGGEGEARACRSAGPGAGPRGGAESPSAANTDWYRYPAARDDETRAAPDGPWAEERHDDYPDTAGAEFGDGWPAAAGGGAGRDRHDPGDRMDGRLGGGADAWDDRAWPAASQGDGGSRAASGRDSPMRRTDGGQGRGHDAHAGRDWDAEPQRDGGGYPTGGAGAAAGSQCDAHAGRQWDAEPQHDGGGCPTGGSGTADGSQRDAHAGRNWGAEPQRDGGGYPTGGAGAAAGSQRDVRDRRHWGSESRRDGGEDPADAVGTATGGPRSARWAAGLDNGGPAAALLEPGIVGPVATPVPGQSDVAYDWWLSSL